MVDEISCGILFSMKILEFLVSTVINFDRLDILWNFIFNANSRISRFHADKL